MEVDIWYLFIFNVRIRIHMIILLQSVTIQLRRLFWHISYYKVRHSNFITNCDRLLLQKCVRYYKVWQTVIAKCISYYTVWQTLLQSASGITKCGSYNKVRRNTLRVNFLDQICYKRVFVSGLKQKKWITLLNTAYSD